MKTKGFLILALAFVAGVVLYSSTVYALPKCCCPAPCNSACVIDPLHGYSECKEYYKQAVENSAGQGYGIYESCGLKYVGTGCKRQFSTCGGAAFTHGDCE